MDTDDKKIILLKKLFEKTNRGTIDWESTPDQNKYQTMVADNLIQISFDNSSQVLAHVSLSILNCYGALVDEFSANDHTALYEELFYPLFKKARDYANGTEQTLTEIINALTEDDVPF